MTIKAEALDTIKVLDCAIAYIKERAKLSEYVHGKHPLISLLKMEIEKIEQEGKI